MSRPSPHGDALLAWPSIDEALVARQAAVEDAWVTPETDVTLLRSELAACRDEIARQRSVIGNVTEAMGHWVTDKARVDWPAIELLLDEVTG